MALVKMNFLSKKLGMQTNVTICLPTFSFTDIMNNNDNVYAAGMKYQVLWLLHGGSGDDSDFVNFSNIVRYADENKIAVVMPADYNAYYSDQREVAKYFSYITDELMNVCQTLYPFSTHKDDNFIGGLSMGSGGAMKCALLRPELYKAALIMSGAGMRLHHIEDQFVRQFIEKVIADEDVSEYKVHNVPEEDLQMTVRAFKIITSGIELPQFYFAWGADDLLIKDIKLGLQMYDKIGLKYFAEQIPGYGHEWDFWDLILKKALKEWLPLKHEIIYPE